MSAMLSQELEKLSRALRRWRALDLLCWGLATVFALLWLLGLFDLAWSFNGAGRWFSSLLIWTLAGSTAFLAARALQARLTPEGLATVVERAFPDLDNHLINYIQFARDTSGNPFKKAYIQSGPPAVHQLDWTRLKNKRAQRFSRGTVVVALALLLLPSLFLGAQWPTALWRVANPLSAVEPVTRTRIVEVTPGNQAVPQGGMVTLRVKVQGPQGHAVRVDLDAADARSAAYEIGRLQGDGQESFSHRVARANTRFRYRFRAGDAPPSEWFTITPMPPPALTALRWDVEPPAYTGRLRQRLNLLEAQSPEIPAGSRVAVEVTAMAPLKNVTLTVPENEPVAMQVVDGDAQRWRSTITLDTRGAVVVEATDVFGQTLRESVSYSLIPDRPPVIEVLAPEGRARLPVGEAPRITFLARDDYGLRSVHIEAIPEGQETEQAGHRVQSWTVDNERSREIVWRGEPGRRGQTRTYRVVAVDNHPDEPQVARSHPIVFNPSAEGEHVADTRSRLEEEARTTLQQVIEAQRTNLESSRALRLQSYAGDAWQKNEERQRTIRRLTRELLRNPARPLGGRTEDVAQLYANEMVLAIDAVARVAGAGTELSPPVVEEALGLQERILRRLEVADMTASRSRLDRQLSALAQMLEALIREQQRIVTRTSDHVERESRPGEDLVEAQEEVADELSAFKRSGEREAASLRTTDAAHAELLAQVVEEARNRRIREEMLLTADRLDTGVLDDALVRGQRAHDHLEHLQQMLDQVRVRREEDRHAAQREALTQVQTTVERLMDMHMKIQESMDAIRGARDESDGIEELLAEEFADIARRNRDTLLTIPVDLHVFSDLNVGNEFVEEVFSIYEEIEQKAGSEQWGADDAVEWLFTKNDEFIEQLSVVEEKVEMIEKWLPDEPQRVSTLTETIDREEMPEDGIALETLNTEVESLISDLLDTTEELEEAARNAATTMAMTWGEHDHFEDDGELPEEDRLEATISEMQDDQFDAAAGAEIGHETAEGEYSSFAGLGDAGNERPDHMEQDGRSSIGREGMAVGETSASSGTIQEGDPNIEERRTEDPTQGGMVNADGEAQTEATGGGKLASGAADDVGMPGGVRRMDSPDAGSPEGMQALLARHADDLYAQASMQNVRVGSLRLAAHHIRQIDDAVARGDIRQLHEHHQAAVAELRRARAQLAAHASGAIDVDAVPSVIQDAMQAGADLAPESFRMQVAEYFKLLNETF